ncbi:hypothetical protein [Streptomyces sp. NPDC050988]
MSSHPLVKVAAPEDAVPPRTVPRRRFGQYYVERHYARGSERTR